MLGGLRCFAAPDRFGRYVAGAVAVARGRFFLRGKLGGALLFYLEKQIGGDGRASLRRMGLGAMWQGLWPLLFGCEEWDGGCAAVEGVVYGDFGGVLL